MYEITSRNNLIWNIRRMQLLVQYPGTLLDIYVDIHKENKPESHIGEIISYFMVLHLGCVLDK